jgi:hypothetical protein
MDDGQNPLRPGFGDPPRREPRPTRAMLLAVVPVVVVALVVLGFVLI